jgi:hypothetical protein
MEIDGRRVVELAIHVKLASEAVLEAARNLATLRPLDGSSEAVAWRHTLDELVALNIELGFMERILRTAAHGDVTLPRAGRNGRTLTS